MIDPLYGGKTAHHVFQTLLDEPMVSPYDAVREPGSPRSRRLRTGLAQGAAPRLDRGNFIPGGPFSAFILRSSAQLKFQPHHRRISLEIIFRPDPNIYDGPLVECGMAARTAKPVTNLSWDNAAIVSGATLNQTRLGRRRHSRVIREWPQVNAPVIVAPGHPDNSVTCIWAMGASLRVALARARASTPI